MVIGLYVIWCGTFVLEWGGVSFDWLRWDSDRNPYAAATLAGVLATGLFAWGIRGQRSSGRRRCPRCWYDMKGTPGLRCPECGHDAGTERDLFRPRRRAWAVRLAVLLALVGIGCATLWPRVRDHGFVSLIPATGLIAGMRWLPEHFINATNYPHPAGSLGDRLSADEGTGLWRWQRRWAAGRAAGLLESSDDRLWFRASSVFLAAEGSPETLPADLFDHLLAAAQADDVARQERALWALGLLMNAGAVKVTSERAVAAVPVALSALESSGRSVQGYFAMAYFRNVTHVEPDVVTRLESLGSTEYPSPASRRFTQYRCLGFLAANDPLAADALVRASRSLDRDHRREALVVMLWIEHAEEPIISRCAELLGSEPSLMEESGGLWTGPKWVERAALPALMAGATADDDPGRRASCLRLLLGSPLPDAAYITALLSGLGNSDQNVRLATAELFSCYAAQFGESVLSNVVPTLKEYWKDPALREILEPALRQLGVPDELGS